MTDAQTCNSAMDERPRRFWQGVVIVYALMFLAGAVLIAMGRMPLGAGGLAVGSIDVLALVALAGHAWRRPLRGAGLQLLVFLLAAIDFIRAGLVIIVVWPNLLPWRGDEYAWQALFAIATALLLALVAVGLYSYATDRSHAL